MMHTFMVTFCFHIEFHRMATVVNCCKLKIKLKILKGEYCYINVICYHNVISYRLIFHNWLLSPKSLLGEICTSKMEKYPFLSLIVFNYTIFHKSFLNNNEKIVSHTEHQMYPDPPPAQKKTSMLWPSQIFLLYKCRKLISKA